MIVFIYLIFGPPIGGLATILGFFTFAVFAEGNGAFFESFAGEDIGDLLMMPVWMFLMSLWGYVFGGAQAAMTGLILAVASDREGRFGYDRTIIATFPPSLIAGIVISGGAFPALGNENGLVIFILTLTGVVASIAVRFLFRKRFGATAVT